jgi:hypothetical protein
MVVPPAAAGNFVATIPSSVRQATSLTVEPGR